MKHRIAFILLLILSTFSIGTAQTIDGDWYTPLRNKLLHITISKDSIVFRKCSFDIQMNNYGNIDMAFKIEKEVNGYYIVSGSNDTVPAYYLIGFTLNNGRNNLNIESLNKKFSSISEAEKQIPNILLQPLHIPLLSKQMINKIRQGSDISKMTTDDFKKYALKIIEFDSINAKYRTIKYKLSYLYIESTTRLLLSELQFNPLVKGHVFDSMFEKFAEAPETRELFMKMAGGK